MNGYHDEKTPDTFTDAPPEWAYEVFSDRQRERLTFTKLWCKSVAASSLPKSTKLVALTLSLYFSGNEYDSAAPSVDRLADETSMHRSTVIGALDRLEDVGLIERERSRGRVRTRYTLIVPHELPKPPQPSDSATVGQDDGSTPDRGKNGPTVGLTDATVGLSEPTVGLDDATVASPDPKGLEGFTEGKEDGGSSQDAPGRQSFGLEEPDPPEQLRNEAYRYGRLLKGEIDKGKMQHVDALNSFATVERLHPYRKEFIDGLNEVLAEVAS